MVQLLVEKGAKIDAIDVDGRTPLDMALGRYDPEPLDPPMPSVYPETAALLERLCSDQGCDTNAGFSGL